MDTIECPKCGCEHEPCGMHEEDSGEWDCENCGLKFVVEIEYDPSYSVSCVEHEYGEDRELVGRDLRPVRCRFCVHCDACQIIEDVTT